ncbi:MAG: CooT family nickel-binding protein [Dorea sp.]|nr:CooT family nickel-binding protein [Dorea sp.]
MCLSAVYEHRPEGEALLCRNIANVRIQPDRLTFIDIMGIQTEYEGKLCSLDLMENKILVSSADEESD